MADAWQKPQMRRGQCSLKRWPLGQNKHFTPAQGSLLPLRRPKAIDRFAQGAVAPNSKLAPLANRQRRPRGRSVQQRRLDSTSNVNTYLSRKLCLRTNVTGNKKQVPCRMQLWPSRLPPGQKEVWQPSNACSHGRLATVCIDQGASTQFC